MMATYHVCDICGDDMPREEKRQCFVKVGARKTFREVNPDYDGLPHVSMECCPRCAKRVADAIGALRNRPASERDAS